MDGASWEPGLTHSVHSPYWKPEVFRKSHQLSVSPVSTLYTNLLGHCPFFTLFSWAGDNNTSAWLGPSGEWRKFQEMGGFLFLQARREEGGESGDIRPHLLSLCTREKVPRETLPSPSGPLWAGRKKSMISTGQKHHHRKS